MCVSTTRKAFVLRTHISGNAVMFFCLFGFLFSQVLKVLPLFLISHTLHSANTGISAAFIYKRQSQHISVCR